MGSNPATKAAVVVVCVCLVHLCVRICAYCMEGRGQPEEVIVWLDCRAKPYRFKSYLFNIAAD